MSDDKKARQEKAALYASIFEEIYFADPNPLILWMIYGIYRDNRIEPPAYVTNYLDRVSKNITDLAFSYNESKQNTGNMNSRIAEALEMKKPGRSGRGNVFERFSRLNKYWITFSLSKEIDKGTKAYIAVEIVAKKYGVSEATVWRALPGSLKMLEAQRANPLPDEGPMIPF